jgi:2,3-bisphosphoglycerate-independent phosphoglycerate mutase
MNPVLMIFLDGVGIGKEDHSCNPFFKYGFKSFEHFFGRIPTLDNPLQAEHDKFLFPSDALLGVEGFPQSGTGQVSILCGMNAPAFVGKHFGPFPYSTTIPVIKEKNIFHIIKTMGYPVAFANAYPPVFFDYIRSGKQRLSTTSLSCRLSNVKLNTITDLRKGNALTAEITNERWNIKLGYKLPVIKPSTAAKRLLRIASQNAFTLFEFYLTDHIGHGRYEGDIPKTFKNLDDFIYSLLANLDYSSMTLIICSDHGNVEDLSVKTHTYNPALTISAGLHAKALYENIKDISQIKDAILTYCK